MRRSGNGGSACDGIARFQDHEKKGKEDPKGVEIVCVAFEQTRNEKAIRIAMNMIERGTYTLEEICDKYEVFLKAQPNEPLAIDI